MTFGSILTLVLIGVGVALMVGFSIWAAVQPTKANFKADFKFFGEEADSTAIANSAITGTR